jgi:hypothetical protein
MIQSVYSGSHLYKQKRYMQILNLSSDFVIFQGSDFVRGGG